ncbi:MAG: hypothetical protein J6L00_01050, partial [Clostridia bacterium]|nr:hypothetical protein [Clostridia bacterium]
NWCYNEPWLTAANNNLLTYPAKPKPAYYAVKEALRPALPSARIPKFDWNGGELFTAELWYLNDSPDTVSDVVEVSIAVSGEETFLLEWKVDDVAPRTNKIGPSVNFKLPSKASRNEIKLILRSAQGRDSAYTLLFRHGEKPVFTNEINN